MCEGRNEREATIYDERNIPCTELLASIFIKPTITNNSIIEILQGISFTGISALCALARATAASRKTCNEFRRLHVEATTGST